LNSKLTTAFKMPAQFCSLDSRGVGSLQNARGTDAVIGGTVGQGGANKTADAITVQMLLNQAAIAIGVPHATLVIDGKIGPKTVAAISAFQNAKLGHADGRVDPNQKTLAALNEVAKGGATGSAATAARTTAQFAATPRTTAQFAATPRATGQFGAVARTTSQFTAVPRPAASAPPPVAAPPSGPASPTAKALEQLPLAIMWATGAQAHASSLLAGMNASGGVIFLPFLFNTVNTHFHLDRDPSSIMVNLQKIVSVFSRINRVLARASTFFRDGPALAKFNTADAVMGGFNHPGTDLFFITFRPGYVGFGPKCRTAMIIHEGAHFVGGDNQIKHFAMEFPKPNGTPQDTGTRNYTDMLTSEALCNASSYAAFAIHATTGIDSRFGAGDPNV
jgi:peptidoglycan hydrolase-like protein with peptidoglycan-binding domain